MDRKSSEQDPKDGVNKLDTTKSENTQSSEHEKDEKTYPSKKVVLPAMAAIYLAMFLVALVRPDCFTISSACCMFNGHWVSYLYVPSMEVSPDTLASCIATTSSLIMKPQETRLTYSHRIVLSSALLFLPYQTNSTALETLLGMSQASSSLSVRSSYHSAWYTPTTHRSGFS